MTEAEARLVLADALDAAVVRAFRAPGLRQSFVDEGRDIPLESLDIDSLAAMEICIAIEVNTGVAIVPDDLEALTSLGQLVSALVQGSP